MLDTTAVREAYRALLEAAAAVADSGWPGAPAPGEWNGDQILAHVCLVTAGTIASVATVAAGEHATYDNRIALDTWTIDRVADQAGGYTGLVERLRCQAEILCGFGGSALTEAELNSPVPLLGLNGGALLTDAVLRMRDLFTGLAEIEIPNHTRQLLDLLTQPAAQVVA